ncbi:hypothetical protein Pfo_009538 [Paulownia fortunei]|nr:hypothetical protein Pfo_009538 [Paulownia fortunei]
MSSHSLNLCGVLSETKRIINAHSRHFLALSVLFILPLSFSVIVYLSVSQSPSILSHYHRSLFFVSTPEPEIPPIDKSHLLLPIVYGFFVLLFSLCGTASITYSTFHGFYGRPVKLISSIKSILFSFFPLIATLVITQIIVGLIVFAFGVEWCLSNVIVVVESQWGFAPLKRSAYLVKGMRRVAFAIIMLFGILLGFLAMLCSSLVPDVGGISGGWVSWAFIFQTVVYTGFMTILMLYSVAANAVLFMYCKALQGELAFEIAEEFAQEYISLPFDDGKVPHVVYVV